MGLYIGGLRLPKKGMYTSFTVYSDGRVVFKFGGDHAGQAIEVPAHGELIDRGALPTSRVEWEDILDAPVVIPAEEET